MKKIKFYFFCILSIAVISITSASSADAFQGNTHKFIAKQAISISSSRYLPLTTSEYGKIVDWSEKADYYNYTNNNCYHPYTIKLNNEWGWCYEGFVAARDHFWNADTKAGLFGFWTAKDKAKDFYKHMNDSYAEGKYSQAFELLGATIHLVSDMGSPAHVHNDDHSFEDFLESYVEENERWSSPNGDIPQYPTLESYMYNLNQRASWFPSNGLTGLGLVDQGVEGNDLDEYGLRHSEWDLGPHYSVNDLFPDIYAPVRMSIADVVIPLTIKHAAGVLSLAFNDFYAIDKIKYQSKSLAPNIGEPVYDIHKWDGYWVQNYIDASGNESITIYNPNKDRVYWVHGQIWSTVYRDMGPQSRLGLPTSNEYLPNNQDNVRQDFEHGFITRSYDSDPWQAYYYLGK
ncbi:MAG: hypothetical protein FD174_4294 [Geobacteraceae bacterium]|nr:MAG: hypothetical protein FD174_4294 [Geobacteraceae bacterium]